MQVILKQDVEKLGLAGEVVEVKDGYGRNYLIPTGKAVLATESAKKAVDNQLKKVLEQRAQDLEKSKETAEELQNTNVTIAVKAGEEGKIFGTVTNVHIADALKDKGFDVDRRKIQIDQDVRQLGEYTATINLHEQVNATLTFWVVKAQD
ncbi:50S ribosomal protein L9 [Natronogracilivirga saccharolytica]|uniref:Large ribosomal subunit protein bL9 n=1 Tax=Natronogracilivirga saccharolytica TaxID=2812953 RepID=A0A8J7RK06_9BACT|nr:50S ribosomal protein L9 [Natronogracilivirga saccharolytica]MBP3192225.1 50S ribosomal protein L9 [Natronogracilivirga saccharolytica]